ncbi:cysteine desulfurase [Rubritalea squalenifaciens DSM 18772]|uniref:cysteine desulfurase n=1 Tax=Rubritalea squalenifaciens DSM 18772 TaxID=1123071 RepID=A0A1M6I1N6_9BACT|nr:cysteine desulfurase family protein [Rubritalea squalenifaciens]SHJ28351.1 cysteine desulfurase [Rubritalea squalenifaciens DSM 18772]
MIYLDSNATTQVHPEVLEAMLPYLTDQCYNPSSGYRAGKKVKEAIEEARVQMAQLINAEPDEIYFTGCGTESNNAVLLSLAKMAGENKRIVTSAIEHSAILRVCEELEREGFLVERVGVDSEGRLDLDAWKTAVSKGDVCMATLMWANNETGVIQPIAEAYKAANDAGVPFHTDAIQAVGKAHVDVKEVPVDFLSISGHKFHAPKGVGALYIRQGVGFEPLLRGGGQEKGKRSGTENVASIIGMGTAAELMRSRLEMDCHDCVGALRDHLEHRLLTELDGVQINGSMEHRTKNTSHLSFEGCEAAGLLILLDEYGVACSAGSACMTGKQKPSHVQKAMGFDDARAKSSLRISFSILTTKDETDKAVEAIKKAVGKLRSVQGAGGVGPVVVYT